MGALASAFHGLATKGPLGQIGRGIGTVGGKIGLPGMSSQGVPGFKQEKPSVGAQAGQLGALGQQMNPALAAGAAAGGEMAGAAGVGAPGPDGAPAPVAQGAPMLKAPGQPGQLPPGMAGGGGPLMGRGPLTPRIALSGAQRPAQQFPPMAPGTDQPIRFGG